MTRYERPLDDALAGQTQTYDEGVLYYAIAKSMETDKDYVTPLLRRQVAQKP